MNRSVSVALVVLASVLAISLGTWNAWAEAPAAPAAGELKVLKIIPGGGEGGWDFVTADPQGKRVYVARSNRFMVFDVEAGKRVGEIADCPGAHGMAIVPDLALGFTTNGKDNTMSVIDLNTLKTLRKINTGEKPDAVVYDPATQKVFCCNGKSGDLTIVDPKTLDAKPQTLAIGGKLEVIVSDGAGRLYVNVEDKSEIVAIDAKELKVLAHWPLGSGEGPTGLAIDVAHRRLFAGCANEKMIVLDADKGAVLATLPIGPGVDGVEFDATLGVAVAANGGIGTATVVREESPGKFAVVQTLKTSKTARTIAVDSKTHQFFLPGNITGDDGKTSFGLVVVGAEK
jgi:YVTN family beta-propeller protein